MADLTDIRETHRVHEHAAAAIVRAHQADPACCDKTARVTCARHPQRTTAAAQRRPRAEAADARPADERRAAAVRPSKTPRTLKLVLPVLVGEPERRTIRAQSRWAAAAPTTVTAIGSLSARDSSRRDQ